MATWATTIPMYFRDDNAIRNNFPVRTNFWSPANPSGKYPRNISGARAKIEPNMWQKRSFIRLQDVSVAYNLNKLVKKAKFQALNVFVSGKNLVKTWTDWEGWDPEALDLQGNPMGLITAGQTGNESLYPGREYYLLVQLRLKKIT